jgi:CRISPR-associated protein Cmr4
MDKLTLLHLLSTVGGAATEATEVGPPDPAREHPTGIPFVPGRILTTGLRSIVPEQEDADAEPEVSETPAPSDTGFHVSDHRLLLLPARSYRGTFAWVSSPLILHRFLRDAGDMASAPPPVPQPGFEEDALVGYQGLPTVAADGNVVLEDLDFLARGDAATSAWAGWIGERLFPGSDGDSAFWRAALAARLCVVHDDVISYLIDRALALAGGLTRNVDPGPEEKPLTTSDGLPAEAVLQGTTAGTSQVLAALEAAAGVPFSVGGGLARLVIGGVRP